MHPAISARVKLQSTDTMRRFVVVLILAIHSLLLGWGAIIHSPTLNEPAHIAAGIENWRFGRFDVYKVNPPLVRLFATLPILDANTDWHSFSNGPGSRPELQMGQDFIAANGSRTFWLFTLARWTCIPFSLIGAIVTFRWANELYGGICAFLALVLWCFSPSILGHGQLVTPDVACTSLALCASYTFWHWLQRQTWSQAIIAGLAFGIAQLTRTTLLVLIPVWLILWPMYRRSYWRHADRSEMVREFAQFMAQMLIGLFAINAGYGFERCFTPLGQMPFVSDTFGDKESTDTEPPSVRNRFAGTLFGSLPMPLPENYVLGIDIQKRDFEHRSAPSYLLGQFRDRGWWYYYLYGFLIKMPLGNWLLLFLACIGRLLKLADVPLRDEVAVLFPAVAIVAFVSAQTGFSEHFRYAIPALGFANIWVSSAGILLARGRWGLGAVACAAVIWSIISSMLVYPHSLSYFNELAGGPLGGPAYLIHSNVDWGQDLFTLKKWLERHPEAAPIKLAYFGAFDPELAGIKYSADFDSYDKYQESKEIPAGWYAISINFVRGLPFSIYAGNGTKLNLRPKALVSFQKLRPVAMAGYSICIYHVLEPGN